MLEHTERVNVSCVQSLSFLIQSPPMNSCVRCRFPGFTLRSIDEYGGTAFGLITIEDIRRRLLAIVDEYDFSEIPESERLPMAVGG